MSGMLADAGDKLIAKQTDKIDIKLKAKYGIEKDDSLKVATEKMLAVESVDNPAFANKLLLIAPEYWGKFTDENASWSDKVAAGVGLVAAAKKALGESKDENGTVKWASGSTIAGLSLIMLKFLFLYRKKKKNVDDLIVSIENPDPEKGVKGAVGLKNNADLNNDIGKRYPKGYDKIYIKKPVAV